MSKRRQSDCDIIMNDFENLFGSMGNCFDTVFDKKKSKMQVAGSLFGLGKSIAKTGWDTGSCAVKHTPKAIVTVAKYKREFVDSVTGEINKIQKQIKEDELEEKIKRLAVNKKEISL